MGEYDKTLVLTTPHIHDKLSKGPVHDAQWLMQGNSVFGPGLACYKDGPLDGDFGPVTAQAAARTKYWLGYAQKNCDPTFGQPLYDILVGKAKLSSSMKNLRNKRLAAKSPGQDAIEFLRQYIGYHENPPGSNLNMFGAWYSQIMRSPGWNGVPWCAETESYCFWHTGWKRFIYASVENIYWDAAANRNGLRIVHSPQQGDVVLYSFGGHKYAHTAFYDAPIDSTSFYDLGGNTGPIDISNGGAVLRQKRSTAIVLAYVRVG